ncbi:MAG TPA: sodium:solute symporter family protein [Steroidobacteraceae bacterium]|nr:sodium:solute symporter family protein [Steroidobacteraceae bacterium]
MNAYVAGILLSLAVYLAVGTWAGRRVKHLDDYFVAGRQAPTLLILGTLVASLLSTTAFLGEVGMAYSGHGALVLALVAINVVGYIVGALYFGRHLRRSRALTVAEYFGRRFASRRVQSVAGIMIVVGLGAYLMAVTQGTALVVTAVSDVSYRLSLLIVWAAYTAFTFYSGSRGVVINDTMMFILFMIAGFVALGCVVGASGGWLPAVEALATFDDKPGIISWHGVTGPGANWQTPADAMTWAVILGLAWSVVVAVSPWQASRYLMAKNEHVVIRAGCGAGLALLVLYPALMFCGAAINLGNSRIEPVEGAMIWAAENLMPTLAGVVVLAGIVAAGLSSATTFLSLVAFSASHDVLKPGTASDAAKLRISRRTMLGVGLAALALAMFVPPNIFWITYFAGTVFASSWGPVAFMSVWSRRITEAGAFWGIVAGFAGNVVPKALALLGVITLPVWADPIILGALLGAAVTIAVSRRGTVSEAEHRYRLELHQVPGQELDAAEMRRTLRWPAILIAGGVLLAALMVAFYAFPYRAAAGQGTGELLLSLGCGLVLVACGLLARWAVLRESTNITRLDADGAHAGSHAARR